MLRPSMNHDDIPQADEQMAEEQQQRHNNKMPKTIIRMKPTTG